MTLFPNASGIRSDTRRSIWTFDTCEPRAGVEVSKLTKSLEVETAKPQVVAFLAGPRSMFEIVNVFRPGKKRSALFTVSTKESTPFTPGIR